MLENHPITWHTRFIPLLIAGLSLWLIAFVFGFLYTNYAILRHHSVGELYFTSFFVAFHAVFGLIILCIWAINFYKNNPLKSFYPVQPFYLIRVFLQLFFAFFLLTSAIIPFKYGVFTKTKQLLPKEETKVDIEKLNFAYPFLINDVSKYDISFKVYPKPFPLEQKTYDRNNNSWNLNLYTHSNPNYKAKKYISNEEFENFYFYTPKSTEIITLNGTDYFFYTSETKYESADSCNAHEFLKDKIDVSTVPNLHENTIYNFSKLLIDIDNENQNYSRNNYYIEETRPNEVEISKYFQEKFAPKIHTILDTNNLNAIEHSIDQFKTTLSKYGIDHKIDSKKLSNYLKIKDFKDFNHVIVGSYKGDGGKNNDGYSYDYDQTVDSTAVAAIPEGTIAQAEAAASVYEAFKTPLENRLENYNDFYFEKSELEELFNNYTEVNSDQFHENYEFIIGFLIFAFVLAWFFLWFEFTNIISMLISIPIAGVISILVTLFILLLNFGFNLEYSYREKFNFSASLIVLYSILGLTIFGIFNEKFPKKITNILINLSYPIAPIILILTILFFNESTKVNTVEKCGSESYDYEYLIPYYDNPLFMLLFAFIGLFAYLSIIKKWRAKKE